MGESIIVLSPHSDDAALSVPSTIRLLQQRGCEITVLTCFSRSNWAPERQDLQDIESISAVRIAEDQQFAAAAGSHTRVVPLGFNDFPIRRPADTSPILPGESPEGRLVNDLIAAIRPFVSTAQMVLAPLGLGSHLDHCVVTAASLLLPCPELLAFYEDIPYRLHLNGDQLNERVSSMASRLRVALHPFFVQRDEQLESWYHAMSCYPSQFSPADIERLGNRLCSSPGECLWIADLQMSRKFVPEPPGCRPGGS